MSRSIWRWLNLSASCKADNAAVARVKSGPEKSPHSRQTGVPGFAAAGAAIFSESCRFDGYWDGDDAGTGAGDTATGTDADNTGTGADSYGRGQSLGQRVLRRRYQADHFTVQIRLRLYPLFAPAKPVTLHHRESVSYTHLRAHETRHDLVCRL